MSDSRSFRPSGALDSSALETYEGPWNRRTAAHLLRRAGFGGSSMDVDTLSGMSMHEGVERLLHASENSFVAKLDSVVDPYDIPYGNGSTQEQIEQVKARRRATYRADNVVMQTWWLERMLGTTAPLHEKMTLFWHGHFPTDWGNKGVRPKDVIRQNLLYRRFALGNIRELTRAISRDPGMLKYLDNVYSRKGRADENFARELMELFTLGIGNYSERDVRESARAFTGYTIHYQTSTFYERTAWHDGGWKTFLGRSGTLNGDDIIDAIFEHPAASAFFARKILSFFVYDDPESHLVEQVADLVKEHDFELLPVMSKLLRSNVFYSGRAYRALVKSPVELVIGTFKMCQIEKIPFETLAELDGMGQSLFLPPSVKGWDGGITWINTQTMLDRANFLRETLTVHLGKSWMDDLPSSAHDAAEALVETILQGDASRDARSRLAGYIQRRMRTHEFSKTNINDRIRGAAYLTMMLPVYQLC